MIFFRLEVVGAGFVEKSVFMRGNFYKEICYLLFLQL